jgi:CheY-like chemotaxis protein
MPARVLVIDDTGYERVVEEALFRADFGASDVEVVPSFYGGVQALWHLCWQQPSQLPHLVVLTAQFKNGSSGYRLLEFMQRHSLLRLIAVIVYSPHGAMAERYMARKRGAQYCLNQQATTPEVAHVLSQVVRLGSYRPGRA